MKIILKSIFSFFCIILLAITAYAKQIEFPLVQSMTYFPYSHNTILQQGKIFAGLDFYYSNVYMFDNEKIVVADFETFSNTIQLRYGLLDFLTIEAYLRYSFIYGGILDSLITGFHDTFGFPEAHREDFPENQVNYKFKNIFNYQEAKGAFSPLILSVLTKIYQTESLSFKARLAMGLPLSEVEGLASGKSFLTFGLVFGFSKKWFSLEFSNYLSSFEKPAWLEGEVIDSSIYFAELKLEIKRFILGFIFRTSPFNELDVDHSAYQTYIGYRISRSIDFVIFEDWSPYDTTPDISFHLSVKIFDYPF